MTPNEYQIAAARTLNKDLDINTQMSCYALGIAGEAGEVADYLKKVLYHGHKLDKEVLIKEVGDVLWYAAALLTAIGTPMEYAMLENISKLLKRYPSGFSSAASINRKDK